MSEIVHVPFHGDDVLCVEIKGRPHVVLKPALDAIGLDYPTQRRKLAGKSWSVEGLVPSTGADGKTYEMVTVELRTFLMLLATVDERRVADAVRPALVAYQSQVADVIEAHFTRRHRGIDEPDVLTWDDTCAVMRQRYGLDLTPMSLIRKLKQAGVLKQNSAPKSKYAHMFWFTGSAYNVHPYMIRPLAAKIANADFQLDGMRSILQLELELEGVANTKEINA